MPAPEPAPVPASGGYARGGPGPGRAPIPIRRRRGARRARGRRLFAAQADALCTALTGADWLRDIPRCADDPVSADAKVLVQAKVDRILDAHWAHLAEIAEAAARLREAALQYRYTEDDLAGALAPARARLGLPSA